MPVATAHSPFDRFDGLAGRVVDARSTRALRERSGESVLYVVVATVLAPQMSSVMPSTEQMDDSFTIVTSSLASAGRMFLIACGSTTSFMLCHELRPSERAASFCPLVHSENARADDLRDIRRGVERKRHHAGNEAGEVDEAQDHDRGDLDHAEKAVENNRRAAPSSASSGTRRCMRRRDSARCLLRLRRMSASSERRHDRETYRYDRQQQRILESLHERRKDTLAGRRN